MIEEYLGDAQHQGLGVREAYLVAGERAIDRNDHSVIRGTAPATATLRLHKEFATALHPNQGANAHIDDVLDSTLDVAPSGDYEWDVNPSGRPFHEGETYTMSCELPGEDPVSMEVFVARGDKTTANWSLACAAEGGSGPVRCHGEVATIVGSKGRDRGKNALLGTNRADVFQARGGDDVVRAVGGDDIVCGGAGADVLDGGGGDDLLRGGPGKDSCPGSKPSERKSCRVLVRSPARQQVRRRPSPLRRSSRNRRSLPCRSGGGSSRGSGSRSPKPGSRS